MKGEPRISFRVLGLLLKSRGIVTKNRVPLWEIALGLVLYQLGLSFRRTALVLSRLGKDVSHVAVWYWNRKAGMGFKPYSGPLPPVIVVDETWVRVKGKDAWIHVALDPRTLRIIYLKSFFRRDEYTTDLFLEHLVEEYGKWPREVITDGGSWYRAAF